MGRRMYAPWMLKLTETQPLLTKETNMPLKGPDIDTPNPKVKSSPEPKARNIESYINRGVPAPQPSSGHSIYDQVERESNKRRNQP
jgi:hypothetical protein